MKPTDETKRYAKRTANVLETVFETFNILDSIQKKLFYRTMIKRKMKKEIEHIDPEDFKKEVQELLKALTWIVE